MAQNKGKKNETQAVTKPVIKAASTAGLAKQRRIKRQKDAETMNKGLREGGLRTPWQRAKDARKARREAEGLHDKYLQNLAAEAHQSKVRKNSDKAEKKENGK